MIGQNAQIIVDGQLVDLGMTPSDKLVRAVIISLFTWRRANAGDTRPTDPKWGWWGDTFAPVAESKIGSRLWLLAREKMTKETVRRAKDYASEALQWLIEDGVASAVDVKAERGGLDRLNIMIVLTRADGSKLDLRFADMWSQLNV